MEYIISALETHPDTKAAWELVKVVRSWADVGRHFRSEVFLYWALIKFVARTSKTHILQFFIGGHGKTGRLDGTTFGTRA